MTYDDALELVMGLADFERSTHSPGHSKFHLERMTQLMERLGNVHLRIPTIHVAMADGSGVPVRLTNNGASDAGPAWSPDGTQIAFASTRLHVNGDVFVMNADGTGQTALTNLPSLDGRPDWSPDGLKILFDSNRDDNNGDNFVMNTDVEVARPYLIRHRTGHRTAPRSYSTQTVMATVKSM